VENIKNKRWSLQCILSLADAADNADLRKLFAIPDYPFLEERIFYLCEIFRNEIFRDRSKKEKMRQKGRP
jgi:hypothetical protein